MIKHLLASTVLFGAICCTSLDAQVTELGRIDLGANGSNNVMGIKIGPDGKIYFVDRTQRAVYRIDNENVTDENLDGYLSGTNTFTEIASGTADGLSSPVDLDFNPQAPEQLWVVNQGTNSTGGSTSTIMNPGEANQTVDYREDGNRWHFMALATSMAFGDNGNWATAQGIQDANRRNGTFTGPSLWSGDMSIYAMVGDPPTSTVNGSHLDMIHQSPFGMGIAHHKDNAYWVFDGYSDNLVYYDFVEPHYPGGFDHSDGIVRRYVEVQLERKGSLPAHMVVDKFSGQLFICDTDNGRVVMVNTNTGEFSSNLTPSNGEALAEYSSWVNVTQSEVVTGLQDPVGIDISQGKNFLIVSDNATNEIIVYSTQAITGIEQTENPVFSFNLYPNPANDIINFNFVGAGDENMNLMITDLVGKAVINRIVNPNQFRTLDLSDLPAGIYNVTVTNGSQFYNRKLILN